MNIENSTSWKLERCYQPVSTSATHDLVGEGHNINTNSHVQGTCSDLSSTYSPTPNSLSPPNSNPNPESCHHVNTGTLSILYFNARSLIPKFDELCLLVETHQPDIVCIVETWLDPNFSDNEIHLPGFQLYWLDCNHHGGGVLMYAQHILIVNVLPSQLQYNVPHNSKFLPISVSWNCSSL